MAAIGRKSFRKERLLLSGSSPTLGCPGLMCFDSCKAERFWQLVLGNWEYWSCPNLGTYTLFSSLQVLYPASRMCFSSEKPLSFKPQIIFTCSSKNNLTVAFSSTRYKFSISIYVLLHWSKRLRIHRIICSLQRARMERVINTGLA